MWSVEPPTFTVAETAALCVRGINNRMLADRVRAAREVLTANSERLRQAAVDNSMHTLTEHSCPLGQGLSAKNMEWLYTSQLARQGRPARAHYDSILRAALHGLCSYCQYGAAKTLDHVVPKSRVPALAIDPWNLVPCCGDCNHTLGNAHSDQPGEQLLHPYAMPPTGRWLFARVREQIPVTVEFRAEPAPSLTTLLQQRIRHQFEALKLGAYFARVVAQQLTTTSRILLRHWTAADHQTVRTYLRELAEQEALLDVNGRRAVVYEALADSDWYCHTGFRG
ncbi:HNH endonuclease [Nocardia sp. BMG111209]|uniref:HNH endonuclease n=1 Tax=Nocardia sp. BMG111209 TaxID=1160137 RepID=UPI0012DBCEC6|nr:HNH endonuclease [Nocardia sp. BMG111209]